MLLLHYRRHSGGEIVHIGVGAEAPLVGKRVIDQPLGVGEGEAGGAESGCQLLGPDEALPLMGADGEPAEDQLGAENRERIGLEGAVERRKDHNASRLHQRRNGLEKRRHVRDVLHDFEQQHSVMALSTAHKLLGGCHLIVDVEPGRVGVRFRCLDGLGAGVDSGHARAEPRQGLADKAPATADVEHAQARKAQALRGVASEAAAELVADIGEAHRVDAMELPEGAASVPPLSAEPRKAGDFLAVERE